MWHKSTNATMGITLIATGDSKLLMSSNTGATSLNTVYYDLADENGNIVGKVFNDLKIFVIEDQELLFAMSYKSNRSWTLPDFYAGTSVLPDCPAMTPVIMWKPISVSTPTLTVVSREYCHSTSGGWVSIPDLNETFTLVGMCNSGYRVGICNSAVGFPANATIGAYNISDDSAITVCAPVFIAPNTCGSISMTNFNSANDYYFTGAAS